MSHPHSGPTISQEELLQLFLTTRGKGREAEFITVADAAEMVGCTHNAILKWISEGKIEAVKVGGRFQIWRPTLNDHLHE